MYDITKTRMLLTTAVFAAVAALYACGGNAMLLDDGGSASGVQSAVTEAATTTRTAGVPAKLVGVWHKNMTQAEWDRVGVSRALGVYTIVIKKTGQVIVYLPGTYRAGCTLCFPDFETNLTTASAGLMLEGSPYAPSRAYTAGASPAGRSFSSRSPTRNVRFVKRFSVAAGNAEGPRPTRTCPLWPSGRDTLTVARLRADPCRQQVWLNDAQPSVG